MVVILDYGVGNLGSIRNMFKKVGVDAVVSSEESTVLDADRLVLPGVGAFDAGIQSLRATGLVPALEKIVLGEGRPVLGICLGMQLLTRGSEEGSEAGLGWIEADTFKFDHGDTQELKVPHMGWNAVTGLRPHPLLDDLDPDDARFYFLHSYFVRCDARQDALASTDYGVTFDSAVARGNVLGVQFHPEKSHRYGMQLFRNFAGFSPT